MSTNVLAFATAIAKNCEGPPDPKIFQKMLCFFTGLVGLSSNILLSTIN